MNQTPEPTYWMCYRKELRAWFGRNAPSLGELYEGALRILFSEIPFPGRVRFVAHAVREIRNRLPDVIVGTKQNQSLQYKNRLDQLSKKWEKIATPMVSEENKIPKTQSVSIPYDVYQEIDRLVKDHNKSRETPRAAAKRLYEAIDPKNQEDEATLGPRIDHWLGITEWFVAKVHDSGSTDDECDLQELKDKFEAFEKALLAMVMEFFKTTEELDEILEEANA